MKQRILGCCIVLVCMIYIILGFPVCAMANEPDEEEDLASRVCENINITLLDHEPEVRVIKCFDVNEDGWFAIGTRANTVQVYDQYGTFQYGYRFETDGTYGVTFEDNGLGIYLGRSNILLVFDPAGECIHAEEIIYTKEEGDEIFDKTAKQVGNIKYCVERDLGIFKGDYSRLVAIDEAGGRTVLYDATVNGYFAGVMHYLVVISILMMLVGLFKSMLKEEPQENDNP